MPYQRPLTFIEENGENNAGIAPLWQCTRQSYMTADPEVIVLTFLIYLQRIMVKTNSKGVFGIVYPWLSQFPVAICKSALTKTTLLRQNSFRRHKIANWFPNTYLGKIE